jgi:hypothetical protein
MLIRKGDLRGVDFGKSQFNSKVNSELGKRSFHTKC